MTQQVVVSTDRSPRPHEADTHPPMLIPHPAPLTPLRAFPPGAHLRLRLRLRVPPSTSPPRPPLPPAPTPRWPPPPRARASGESIRGGAGPSGCDLDALLSAAELLCLAPPAICSAVCAVRHILARGATVKPAAALASGRLFVLQYVLLLAAVAIGAVIRRRQWRWLSRVGGSGAAVTGYVDLVGRVDKVEDSVRGVVAAVGVLSRTVEKLSLRFRVLRRTLRDPMSETATLAQKNSEATRILAAQENLLEKEIGSIQKVLYAMQEQQEKQLELILSIGEATRILDDKQDLLDEEIVRSSNSISEQKNKGAKIKGEAVTGGNNKP